jgi:hypothetical protein
MPPPTPPNGGEKVPVFGYFSFDQIIPMSVFRDVVLPFRPKNGKHFVWRIFADGILISFHL